MTTPARVTHGICSGRIGGEYTADEREFMLAMERYKRENHRPFPSCCEVLQVLASLGYRKVAPPGTEAYP